MKTLRIVPVFLILFLSTCAPAHIDVDQAGHTLTEFFYLLNKGEYAQADALYGGELFMLQGWNPDIDPADHAALWEAGCTMNGLNCLTIRTARLRKWQDNQFIFTVEFNAPDGNLFVQGPCCGEDETEVPATSAFDFKVVKSGTGQFKVMDMPLYTP